MVNLKLLKRIGGSNIYTLDDDNSAFFYRSGLEIDANGAYHAYHPDGRSGLDYLGNAGQPGNWWALVTDTGQPSGRPVIQTPNDPAPGFYISTTSLEDTACERDDPHRYVNAEAISFIVLPARLGLGAKLGDFAVVVRPETGAYDYAVYADVGSANHIGEGSIALANALGIPFHPKTGGVGHGIVYIVFPGSAQNWPLSQPDIDGYGAQLFSNWGGLDRAKECFPDMTWSYPSSEFIGKAWTIPVPTPAPLPKPPKPPKPPLPKPPPPSGSGMPPEDFQVPEVAPPEDNFTYVPEEDFQRPEVVSDAHGRVVNTGFADRSHPDIPISNYKPLMPNRFYYFWLEVGQLMGGSIEVTPKSLPKLPKEARLTVAVFSFENELKILKPEQTGELRFEANGDVTVSRPAESPDGVKDYILARRLFFKMKTPQNDGSFRLRCSIYCKQVLVQSRLIIVRVKNAVMPQTPQSIEGVISQWEPPPEPTLQSVVDYALSRALDPVHLAELVPNRLSIMLNDNGDGTQGFRFFGYDGKEYFKDNASIDKTTLKRLVAMPRRGLNKVSWGKPQDWDGQRAYLYEDGLLNYKRLTNDLATLAVKGFRVYTKIVEALGRKNRLALGELTRRSGILTISLKESANSVIPAALIYDYNLDSDAFPVKDGRYALCGTFETALKSNAPLENCACFHGRCPVKEEIDAIIKKRGLITEMGPVICPSGFWGYRHAIGLPISVKDGPDAPTQISFKNAPVMGVGIATTLKGWPAHGANLLKLRSDLGWHVASTREDVLKMLQATESHLIYFYCHGGVNQEKVPFLAVGSDDANISPDIFLAYGISWADPRPLVFINGCHTTAITPDIALQFVNPFVQEADAAGVIGTEITVFEPLASTFAEECLKRFFDGDQIGDAVRGARLALLKKCNPLGLAYVPFVLPSLRLSQTPD